MNFPPSIEFPRHRQTFFHCFFVILFLLYLVGCWSIASTNAQSSKSSKDKPETFSLPEIGDIIKINSRNRSEYALVIGKKKNARSIDTIHTYGDKIRNSVMSRHSEWILIVAADVEPKKPVEKVYLERTWNSRNGKFSIKARMKNFDAASVKLIKQDGTPVNVPLTKLSEEDNSYVSSIRMSQAKEESDNPFGKGAKKTTNFPIDVQRLLEFRKRFFSAFKVSQRFKKKLSKAREIKFVPASRGLKRKITNYSKLVSVPSATIPISGIPIGSNFVSLSLFPNQTKAVIFFRPEPRKKSAKGAIVVVDLQQRKMLQHRFVNQSNYFSWFFVSDFIRDISPSGKTIATVVPVSNKFKSVNFFQAKGKTLNSTLSLQLDREMRTPDVVMTSDDSGILFTSSGKVIFIKLTTDEIIPTHFFQADIHNIVYCLSMDRKFLFLCDSKKRTVLAINTKSKRVAAVFKIKDRMRPSKIRISPDGKELQVIGIGQSTVFDIETGKILVSGKDRLFTQESINENIVLSKTVKIEKSRVFNAAIGKNVGTIISNHFWANRVYEFDKGRRILAGFKDESGVGDPDFLFEQYPGELKEGRIRVENQSLPLKEILQNANRYTGNNELLFGKGAKVKLDFRLGKQAKHTKEIRASIKNQFQKHGIQIVDDKNSKFRLIIKYVSGKRQTETYRWLRRTPGFERHHTITIVPKYLSASLKKDNQTIWYQGESIDLRREFLTGEELKELIHRSEHVQAKEMAEWKYPSEIRAYDLKKPFRQHWITR